MIIFAASAAVIKRNTSKTGKQLMLDYSVWDILYLQSDHNHLK